MCLLIDSMEAFTSADMSILKKVTDEGRALIVAANKWDLVEDKFKSKAVKWMDKQVEKGTGMAKGVPITYLSAKTGLRSERILEDVMRVYEKWNTRVSTRMLNNWLRAFN